MTLLPKQVPAPASALEVRGVAKSYVSPDGSRTPVIEIAKFDMLHGEQVGLRGSSGTGKTTFLNIIAGLLTPDAGTVRVDGEEMTIRSESRRDRIRARHVGYVFQTFNLLQGYTALENVLLGMMFGERTDAERGAALLNRVGLSTRMHHRPSQLSVGQQQRVAVARALANQPRLVLADEPTGNLDRRLGVDALALIREVCRDQGAALLLVSHDHTALAAFDRVEDLAKINRAAAT